MTKKRKQAAAGIGLRATNASEEGGRKKRKAASESAAKIKQIADDDEGSDDEFDDLQVVRRAGGARKKEVRVEDMPLVAPGFRLWEGFADTIPGKELAKLAKFDAVEKNDVEALDVQRAHGMALKPFILTEGPFAGRKILMLEPTSTFRFLDLPPEIRLMIYDYLFEVDTEIGIKKYSANGKVPKRPVRSSFYPGTCVTRNGAIWDGDSTKWLGQGSAPNALLGVCRQILEETAPIIYGRNTFAPNSFTAAHIFLDSLGSMREYVRQIKLPEDTTGFGKSRAMFKLLAQATSLQSIIIPHHVVCPSPKWRSRRDRKSPEYLAWTMEPLFKSLAKALGNPEEKAVRDLLDVIRLKPSSEKPGHKCHECKRDQKADCRGTGWCSVKCGKQKSHCADMERRLRQAVAKVLKIELEV